MSNSVPLHRADGPREAHSASRERSRPSSNSAPKCRQPTPSENLSVELPLISTPNVDPSQSRGILRERPGQHLLLPPEKVFPIQIGSELFRLSGASITSDGPSYFTRFFQDQIRQDDEDDGIRTLYIDRDPTVFQDIARHLQGYHIQPLNGTHYVRLFADAQFYSLPRLISQLFESETFIQIGDRHFQVPKDIFSSPGDTPNFFTLGFAAFFSSTDEVFPGLERTGLLRPPAITPPSVPSRSAEIFAQLLSLLRRYPIHIRNEDHRAELLRDCRYFHLRGLEQKLIAHEIGYNTDRQSSEILLRLEDVKPSGISFVADNNNNAIQPPNIPLLSSGKSGWIHYSRPFVDSSTSTRELILEIGCDPTILNLHSNLAIFHGLTKARISSLLQLIAGKVDVAAKTTSSLSLSTAAAASASASATDAKFQFRIDAHTDLILDGKEADEPSAYATTSMMDNGDTAISSSAPESKKRKLDGGVEQQQQQQHHLSGEAVEWKVRTGQWRVRVQQRQEADGLGRASTSGSGVEIVLVAVKLDAFTCERARNARRRFLN